MQLKSNPCDKAVLELGWLCNGTAFLSLSLFDDDVGAAVDSQVDHVKPAAMGFGMPKMIAHKMAESHAIRSVENAAIT